MLLQRLLEYERRNSDETDDVVPPLYAEVAVGYTIELNRQGKFLGMRLLGDPAAARTRAGLRRPMPQVQRSSGIKPLLFADKADYTLGYATPDAKAARVANCHAAYQELTARCLAATEHPDVAAVQAFLANQPLEHITLPNDFNAKAIIAFYVGGNFVTDLPAVQEFWASINKPDTPMQQCLVCGNRRPTLDRLQSKIKGIPGGQTSGTALISANNDPFESYGLAASQNAPVCSACAEGFTRGLNRLLASPTNHFRTANWAFAFWTREAHEFDLSALISNTEDHDVLALLESVRTALPNDIDPTAFYALSLTAAGGRAVVRDWLDTTVGNAKKNLGLWFQRQYITPWAGTEKRYYSLRALAGATVRELKDLPATTPRTLFRAALYGDRIPIGILAQTILRNQAESRVTRPRAALIKLTLLSWNALTEDNEMVELDTANTAPAYLSGRLFAALEQAQKVAINPNASIADRYYGTTSVTPKTTFPLLLKTTLSHLHKMKRDKPGAYHNIENRIEEIMANLAEFPGPLNLKEQGQFALGYYHERAADRQQARDKSRNNPEPDQRQAAMDIA